MVPAGRRVTVGVVTVDFWRECRACDSWLRAKRGRRPHGCPGANNAQLCPCSCAAVVEELVRGLQMLRPLAAVAVRANDGPLGAWARLAFAPLATLCSPSTFCLWPTLAAVGHGHFVSSPVWPNASAVTAALPRFTVLGEPTFVSYDTLPRGHRRSATTGTWRRKRRPTHAGNCSTAPSVVREWVRQRVWPRSIRPPETPGVRWTDDCDAQNSNLNRWCSKER